jgi:hypothetical protein
MKPIQAWNDDKKPDIIWVIIPSAIRQELLKEIPFKFDNKNLNKDASLHHVTLAFKPNDNDIKFIKEWAKENEMIKISIEKNCWNDKIQALKVRVFNKIGKELNIPGKIFHTTVSAEKGIAPKFSNDMLAIEHNSESIKKNIVGTIYYDKF